MKRIAKLHSSERAVLSYPRGLVAPEDWLRFLELRAFTRRRAELGFVDDDIRALQIAIMVSPTGSPVISGTHGVRKMRFSRQKDNRGKSGSYRILYVHFPNSGLVALVTAYGKNEQDNIDADDKKLFRKMIAEIDKALSQRRI